MQFLAVVALFFASALASPACPARPVSSSSSSSSSSSLNVSYTSVYTPPGATSTKAPYIPPHTSTITVSLVPPPYVKPTTLPSSTAVPIYPKPVHLQYCPGGLLGLSNAQCCSTMVLGAAALDCVTPPETPISGSHFQRICAAIGRQAGCCLLPVLGQGVLCQKAIGAS